MPLTEEQTAHLREGLDLLNDAVLKVQEAEANLKAAGQAEVALRTQAHWVMLSNECCHVEELLGIEWQDGEYRPVNAEPERKSP
jgi:hypothetical protein